MNILFGGDWFSMCWKKIVLCMIVHDILYVVYTIVTLLFVTDGCYRICGNNRKRLHDFVKFEVTHQYLLF